MYLQIVTTNIVTINFLQASFGILYYLKCGQVVCHTFPSFTAPSALPVNNHMPDTLVGAPRWCLRVDTRGYRS
ncbi:hypothetical protein IF2G_00015 [Cordyceps javanica]|nr:hypothetical protein IF2G_00015 [Cordyceps javanica]